MRGACWLVVLWLTSLAGCVGPSSLLDGAGADTVEGGWRLLCDVPTTEDWQQGCVMRTSAGPRTKAEMWTGINPADPDNVVIATKDMDPAGSKACVWNLLTVTHDDGQTWQEVRIGGDVGDREPPSPFFGYGCNTDPMFRFEQDGTLHYLVELYNLAGVGDMLAPVAGDLSVVGAKVLLATSHDGGLTWPEIITWHPDLGTLTDYSRMAIGPGGEVYAVINHLDAGFTCHFLASRDGGRTAEPLVKVLPGRATGTSFCRGLAVHPDGTIVVAFRGDGSRGEPLNSGLTTFVRSLDGGRTFTQWNSGFSFEPIPQTFEGAEAPGRPQQNFEIVFDDGDGPGRGTLWALYTDFGTGDADVFVRASPDLGKTWGKPVKVHPDDPHHQYMPNLAIADDASMHVFFYDKGYDPGNRLIDISHAMSLDGGASWTRQRVTNVSWDGDLGRHQYGYAWIGDYLGVDAIGDQVWAGFPDASEGGEPVVAAARLKWAGTR